MTLLDRSASETFRESHVPVIETERLVLRAPRFEDANMIATLVNDRRIAENTLRIPHPYGLADAQSFITGANASDGETVFLITRRDATVLRLRGCPAGWRTARDRLLARRCVLGQRLRHRSGTHRDRSRVRRSRLRGAPRRRAREQSGFAPSAGEMRIRVDGSRALSHPLARLVRAIRPISARSQAVGAGPAAAWERAKRPLKLGTE